MIPVSLAWSAAKGVIGGIPRWVWYLLAAALLYRFAVDWHDRQIKAHDTALIAERDAAWRQRLDAAHAEALAWRGKFDAATAALATEQRKLNDAQNARINAAAGRERVLGPGKAAAADYCRQGDHSALASSAGGPGASLPAGDDAGDHLPAGDREAVVPWGWLVSHAQQCDLDRAEGQAWRTWYAKMKGLWPTK